MDINADMGESFGRYSVGNDAKLMEHVTSVSIACGFHAGDPRVMHDDVAAAVKLGLNIGAHPGLPDREGFGRRFMQITPEELRDYVVYQMGALDAFLARHDRHIRYVKPHGALYRMVEDSRDYAEALCDAVIEYNPELAIVTEAGRECATAAAKHSLRVIHEGFPDLDYDSNGNWVIERNKKHRTPEEVARRALSMARDGRIETVEGNTIPVRAETLCVHGDAANAVDVAKAVNAALSEAGVQAMPFL